MTSSGWWPQTESSSKNIPPSEYLLPTLSYQELITKKDYQLATLLQDILQQPLHCWILQFCLKSLYWYIAFTPTSALPYPNDLVKFFNPMSPLTASLQVLDEQPRIYLSPSNTTDSNATACVLLSSQTSLP